MSVTNVKIGACKVLYGGTDLGHTKGGVTVSYEPEYADKSVDKWGNSKIGRALIGEQLTVTVPLAELSIANLLKVIPASTSVNGGLGATVGKQAKDMTGDEKELVLHPLRNADNDYSEDVVIYKAAVTSNVELNYEVDNQTVYEVTFEGYIDANRSDGAGLGHFGKIS